MKGNEVKGFLLGKGAESESFDSSQFEIADQMKEFMSSRGMICACGTGLKIGKARTK
jgi:hypothetical protein